VFPLRPALAVVLLSLSACGEGDEPRLPPTDECRATRVNECPDPAPSYADVAPIFRDVCRDCHALPGGPWPLSSYSAIADWKDVVRDELLTCAMPPADGGVTLRDDDRQLILAWIRCGVPE